MTVIKQKAEIDEMYGANLAGLEANYEAIEQEFELKGEAFIDVKEGYEFLEKLYNSNRGLFDNLDSMIADLDVIVKRYLNTFILNMANDKEQIKGRLRQDVVEPLSKILIGSANIPQVFRILQSLCGNKPK